MRCPILSELPPPPPGKIGWPWTEESPQLLEAMPDGRPWPRVSIVTPSYNQGQFIEETIRSVLLQGYPNLEYIIIDGGSTDSSVEIIRKYEPWLAYWVSEPDQGQSDALNKGLAVASAEIIGWLNADDLYELGMLNLVVRCFSDHPEWAVIFGDVAFIDDTGRVLRTERLRYSRKAFLRFWELSEKVGVASCSAFYRRSVFDTAGVFDAQLHYVMDYDFYWRAGELYDFHHVEGLVGHFRVHSESKTGYGNEPFYRELVAIVDRYSVQRPEGERQQVRHSARRAYWRAVVADILANNDSARRFSMCHLLYGVWLNPRFLRQSWFWKIMVSKAIGREQARRSRHLIRRLCRYGQAGR